MAYCNKCGKAVQEGDLFCHSCGAPIAASGKGTAPVPPTVQTPPAPPPVPPGNLPTPPGTAPLVSGPPSQRESLQEMAERRVKRRMALWEHLGVYVIVNIFFVIVWALSGAGYPWFLWIMAAWGIGVALHAMSLLLGIDEGSTNERMIQKELERMRRREGQTGGDTPQD